MVLLPHNWLGVSARHARPRTHETDLVQIPREETLLVGVPRRAAPFLFFLLILLCFTAKGAFFADLRSHLYRAVYQRYYAIDTYHVLL